MNCAQAKNIGIPYLLERVGILPVRQDQFRTYYHSPFSPGGDSIPSLHVTPDGKLFWDWSTGLHGDIIDLAIKLSGGASVSDALRYIENNIDQLPSKMPPKNNADINLQTRTGKIVIESIEPIQSTLLMGYAWGRGIHRNTLTQYCREIHYHIAHRPEAPYYAIGWQNQSGGYELRNKVVKMSIAPKDISIANELAGCTVLVFEGFFDFLTSIEAQLYDPTTTNAIVMNSTALTNVTIDALHTLCPTRVLCLLDHDDAGRHATNAILSAVPDAVDYSSFFMAYKDLNEWFVSMKKH